MSNVVNWSAGLDLDTSKANKKLQRLEARMAKISQLEAKASGKGRAAIKRQAKSQDALNLAKHRQITLENQIDKSIRAIGRSIGKDTAAFKQLNDQAHQLKRQIGTINSRSQLAVWRGQAMKLREEISAVAREQRKLANSSKSSGGGAGNLAMTVSRRIPLIAGAASLGGLASSTYAAGKEFERIDTQLQLATGSAEGAKREFKYLIEFSQRLGLALFDTAEVYGSFVTTSKAAGLEAEKAKKIFEDLMMGFKGAGTSAADMQGIMTQLVQTLSGGNLQWEDLSIIIDRSPAAFDAAKKALEQLTGREGPLKELIKDVKDSSKFVELFSRELKKSAVETGAYQKALTSTESQQLRFQNEWLLLRSQLSETFGETTTLFFKGLTGILKILGPMLIQFGKTVNFIFTGIDKIATAVGETVAALVEKLDQAIEKVNQLLNTDISSADVADFLTKPLEIIPGVKALKDYLSLEDEEDTPEEVKQQKRKQRRENIQRLSKNMTSFGESLPTLLPGGAGSSFIPPMPTNNTTRVQQVNRTVNNININGGDLNEVRATVEDVVNNSVPPAVNSILQDTYKLSS